MLVSKNPGKEGVSVKVVKSILVMLVAAQLSTGCYSKRKGTTETESETESVTRDTPSTMLPVDTQTDSASGWDSVSGDTTGEQQPWDGAVTDMMDSASETATDSDDTSLAQDTASEAETSTAEAETSAQDSSLDSATDTASPNPIIRIEPAVSIELFEGQRYYFHAFCDYTDDSVGGEIDCTNDVTWFTDDYGIFNVNSQGLVRAIGAGSAIIGAAIGTGRSEVSVTVSSVVAIRIINPSFSVPVNAGGLTLSAECTLQGGATIPCSQYAIWEPSSPEISSVGNAGELFLNHTGSTQITASIADVRSAPITLTVTATDCSRADPISFASRSLEADIRARIGKQSGNIYLADVVPITELPDIGRVSNLMGIECLKNLEVLRVHNYQIGQYDSAPELTDLSPLSHLSKLRELTLTNCSLSDLSPLSTLTALEVLDLTDNPITDISALSNMKNLRELYVKNYLYFGQEGASSACKSELTDYGQLSTFDNLQRLEICANGSFDAEILKPLTALKSLVIGAHTIENLAALSSIDGLRELTLQFDATGGVPIFEGLSQLEALDLHGSRLSDSVSLSGLSVLTNLVTLNLSNNQLTAVPFLEGLDKLTDLGLSGNRINDLSNASHFSMLTSLDLHGNLLSALPEIPNAAHIETLDLSWNELVEFPDLSDFKALTELNMEFNELADISAISSLTGLESIVLSCNNITMLPDLTGFDSLKTIALDANQLTDISALVSLTGLESIVLSHNNIKMLPDLTGLDSLKEIALNANQLTDISGLGGLSALEVIHASENRISTLPNFSSLLSLTELTLSKNDLTDISALGTLQGIAELDLHGNNISDLAPLVENSNIGAGTHIDLQNTELNCEDSRMADDISTLRHRGVIVSSNCY